MVFSQEGCSKSLAGSPSADASILRARFALVQLPIVTEKQKLQTEDG